MARALTARSEWDANMRTIELQIRGMTCLDCSRRVQEALTRVPGVEAANIDYRAGRGTVEVNGVTGRDLLLAAGSCKRPRS